MEQKKKKTKTNSIFLSLRQNKNLQIICILTILPMFRLNTIPVLEDHINLKLSCMFHALLTDIAFHEFEYFLLFQTCPTFGEREIPDCNLNLLMF